MLYKCSARRDKTIYEQYDDNCDDGNDDLLFLLTCHPNEELVDLS